MLRIAVAVSVLIVTGCGASAPTSPPPATGTPSTSPFATHTGTWRVTMIVDSCTGHRQCVHSLRKPQTYLVRLLEERGTLTGAFAHPEVGIAIPMQGTRAGRDVVLSGAVPAAFPGEFGSLAFSVSFRGRLLEQPDGQIEYTSTGIPSGEYFGHYVLKGTVVDAERTSAEVRPASFTGRWAGQIATRSCSVLGWPSCSSNHLTIYELVLTQVGTRVTGSMAIGGPSIPVEAEVNGETLTLRGGREQSSSASRSVETLVSYVATRDRIGFLRGTFRYTQHYLPNDGRMYETVQDFELWNVLVR